MAPNYVTKNGTVEIILVEFMVDAIEVHWSRWIVHPVLGGLEVEGGLVHGADSRRRVLVLGSLRAEEQGSAPIAAAEGVGYIAGEEEAGYVGAEDEDREEEGPSLGHGGRCGGREERRGSEVGGDKKGEGVM